MPRKKKTIVYIDALNLYYAIKDTRYKWLDLVQLCRLVLPKNDITSVKYFTARVSALPDDPGAPIRQQVYLRALATLDELEPTFGEFRVYEKRMKAVSPRRGQDRFPLVYKPEEKGSDVNLAVHLVNDGHFKRYESAAVVSNDSDLFEAMSMVRRDLNLPVGFIYTRPKSPSHDLLRIASFVKNVRRGMLPPCQFPATLTDSSGELHKPSSWWGGLWPHRDLSVHVRDEGDVFVAHCPDEEICGYGSTEDEAVASLASCV